MSLSAARLISARKPPSACSAILVIAISATKAWVRLTASSIAKLVMVTTLPFSVAVS